MPKFVTKIYYKKQSDLNVLQNLAVLNAGEKATRLSQPEMMKLFVNDAVRERANLMIEQIKLANQKAKETEGGKAAKNSSASEQANQEGVATRGETIEPTVDSANGEAVPASVPNDSGSGVLASEGAPLDTSSVQS